jgi:thiol-disulfide isomerase/thioredoxin
MVKYLLLICILLSACAEKPLSKNAQGHDIQLSDLKGKWIVLNYFATWCGPCYQEIPELNAFYSAHKDKDAIVLAVNYDALPAAELNQFSHKQHVLYPILQSNPGKRFGITDIETLPATFLIAPNGKIVKTLLGSHTKAEIEQAMLAQG